MPEIINIEPTPNPDALKFVVRDPLLAEGVRSYSNFASAIGDPIGSAIFALGNVSAVFYMDRFVTVNKFPTTAWTDLIDPICDIIEETVIKSIAANDEYDAVQEKDEVFQKIMDTVNSRIRPSLANDGGGLEIISFDGQTLTIAYQGACGSCPAAGTSTLQYIEGLLQHEVDTSIKVAMK